MEVKMLCPMGSVVNATENGKIKRRGGQSGQLRDWVMNTIKRQHSIALNWVTIAP